VERQQLGQRLRALRAARGSTVAAVATEAGLSVPYVANLENGRGNPTLDALNRIAQALGTQATVDFATEAETGAVPLPASLVRFGRSARFRRDAGLIAQSRGVDPTALAGRVLEALAGIAAITGRELGEGDWSRVLDALVLVTLHPVDRPKPEWSHRA
jgi:transcriptional regulator with XRE-family HTH domain